MRGLKTSPAPEQNVWIVVRVRVGGGGVAAMPRRQSKEPMLIKSGKTGHSSYLQRHIKVWVSRPQCGLCNGLGST